MTLIRVYQRPTLLQDVALYNNSLPSMQKDDNNSHDRPLRSPPTRVRRQKIALGH